MIDGADRNGGKFGHVQNAREADWRGTLECQKRNGNQVDVTVMVRVLRNLGSTFGGRPRAIFTTNCRLVGYNAIVSEKGCDRDENALESPGDQQHSAFARARIFF